MIFLIFEEWDDKRIDRKKDFLFLLDDRDWIHICLAKKKKNIQLEHENVTESIYCSKNYNVTVSKNYNVYQSILYLLLSLF